MSSAHFMNAKKCVHAQKPYPRQAFAHESSKVEREGKKKGRETGKTEPRRLIERKAVQQNENIPEEQLRLTKQEEEHLASPNHISNLVGLISSNIFNFRE